MKNKVVIVTGAGGTLCSAIAIHLAERGAKVVLIGRTEAKLQKTAKAIKALGGEYMVCPCDVTDEPAMKAVADQIYARWSGADYLVNGAGGNQMNAMTTGVTYEHTAGKENARNLFDLDLGVFESVLKINTVGTLVPIRAFAPHMLEKGRGAIVNFASMNSYCPLTRVPAYAMSKAAVANFTQWLGAYFGGTGIRVNAVAPGFMVNERSVQYLGSEKTGLTARGQSVISHTPMGRFGQAEDLLGCVDWLLDDRAAAFVTGVTIPVDGGFLTLGGV